MGTMSAPKQTNQQITFEYTRTKPNPEDNEKHQQRFIVIDGGKVKYEVRWRFFFDDFPYNIHVNQVVLLRKTEVVRFELSWNHLRLTVTPSRDIRYGVGVNLERNDSSRWLSLCSGHFIMPSIIEMHMMFHKNLVVFCLDPQKKPDTRHLPHYVFCELDFSDDGTSGSVKVLPMQ